MVIRVRVRAGRSVLDSSGELGYWEHAEAVHTAIAPIRCEVCVRLGCLRFVLGRVVTLDR